MPLPSLLRRPLSVTVLAALVAGGLAGLAPQSASALELSASSGSLHASLAASGTALPTGTLYRSQLPPGAALRTAPGATVPQASLTATPTSNIVVRYVNDGRTWTEPAKAAFEAAVAVWERTIESRVPIEVVANATVLPAGALGSAGPFDFRRNQMGTPTDEDGTLAAARATLADDVFEPVALFNARTGRDEVVGEPDIEASFDPSQSFLYFGLDGRPTASQYDFRSVVLHELGHGLGLVGTAEVDDLDRAVIGLPSGVNGSTGVRSGVSFDQHAYATTAQQAGNGGTRVLRLANGSAALRTALTGDQLYWAGQGARSAAGGAKVRLYGPGEFELGSSFGHLDETTYPRGSANSLMTPVIQNGESLMMPGEIAMGMLSDMGYAVPALGGARFTAVSPVRLLDTREGKGAPKAAVGAGRVVDLQVTGVAGVPAGATAVVLNVTGVAPSAVTDVRVYPTPVTPTAVPLVSNLNLARGTTRANLVTVPIGNNGRVRLRNGAGTVQLLADLAGWYAPAAASTFTAVDPNRVLDTRAALGTATRTPLPAGGQLDLQVTGRGGVPAGATAVAMTVTAVNATTGTDVRVYPATAATATVPLVSNLNARVGPAVPNLVVVKVREGGKVRLPNASGTGHLHAHVAGWYD
ncbi:MAG: N-acetylmuramoyl-L-alanine amidase, partial [Frankiales bacterium]|nr:N-acetylmuramoyl-L-alanine amidase [Frankiales bacterium]